MTSPIHQPTVVTSVLQQQQQQQQQQNQNQLASNNSPNQQISSPVSSNSPFNQYNTEFVKYDTNNWQEIGGILINMLAIQNTGVQEFALLTPDEDLINCPISAADSINNKSFTDVTFIVGPPQHSKKYVGHRVLLAMTSPVFETMFYGDMADKNKYIRIPDVAPIGFENLLRYAYTDSLNLDTVEDAMLTAYAAKKYILPQLLRECLTYIEHNIDPSTACVVFEFAQVLNSQQLVLQAMNLIDRQTSNVISNKSFNHAQASTVEFVANRKYLALESEYSLFNAFVNWSLSEARRKSLTSGDDWLVIRSILKENSILGSIRFLAMTQEEFAKAVAKTSSFVDNYSSNLNQTTKDSNDRNQQIQSGDLAATEKMDQDDTIENSSLKICRIDVENPNSLLNDAEQKAVFLNLALKNVATLPSTLNPSTRARQAPPEHFTLKRFRSSSSGAGLPQPSGSSNLITLTTSTRNIKSITSKFQCLSENVFIVALTIPIRLDVSSYANRTPKFECHLKFTTKSPSSTTIGTSSPQINEQMQLTRDQQQQEATGLLDGSTLLMDTIDESLHISIARDKDCLVRLKRPILIRMGNINDLTLTFQTYALDEDIVALRTPKSRSANFSEQTDGENISWLFFKTSNIEFSEIHYYY